MFLYSETVHTFLARVRSYAKEILEREMHFKISRSRLFYRGIYYPINFVVYEGPNLGYWDYRSYQIGINKRVMLSAKTEVIKDILRHELAHMLMTYLYGPTFTPHSPEFRELCRSYGWGENVSAARSDIETENQKIEGDLASEKLIEKIKKLLSLASSTNPYEAELATIKANELLLKHNLEKLSLLEKSEEEVWVKRVLSTSRNSAKIHAIYEILQTFFVAPVFNYGKGVLYLEVTGSRTNVELADYVANFLDQELERLFSVYQKEHSDLKGQRAKNSFFKGMAEGYVEKIKKTQKEVSLAEGKELIVLEQDLKRQMRLAYSRLGSTSTSRREDSYSKNLGRKAGQNLSIHGAISKGVSKIKGYLT